MTKSGAHRRPTSCRVRDGVLCLLTVVAVTLPTGVWAGLAAGESGLNSVTLTWTAPGDDGNVGTAGSYDIRYATVAVTEGNWATCVQVTGEPSPQPADSAESFTVANLNPSSTYYFAIKAADEVGNWSELSNVVSATTDAEQDPPSVVDDLLAGSATDSSITLTWMAVGDDGNSGTAAQYDLRYSSAPITAANFNAATQIQGEPSPQAAGSQESFTVYGLSENTTYYFAMKVADEVPNWSGLSNATSAATEQESIAPAALDDLVAINVTGTTVDLVWTATGDDGANGTATFYDIRYSTSPITQANWNSATHVTSEPAPRPSGETETFTVAGLSQGTAYYFAVKVGDEVPNWSGLSNVATATTLDQTPPAAISNLQASSG